MDGGVPTGMSYYGEQCRDLNKTCNVPTEGRMSSCTICSRGMQKYGWGRVRAKAGAVWERQSHHLPFNLCWMEIWTFHTFPSDADVGRTAFHAYIVVLIYLPIYLVLYFKPRRQSKFKERVLREYSLFIPTESMAVITKMVTGSMGFSLLKHT